MKSGDKLATKDPTEYGHRQEEEDSGGGSSACNRGKDLRPESDNAGGDGTALVNKKVFYDLLFHATAETLLEVAADPEHLGAQIGFFAVLHSWGQNLVPVTRQGRARPV